MGYTKTDNLKEADIALFNTCCVRENAEDKLFGKLGELKKIKEIRGTIIAIGGCMMQEKHITDKIKESYPKKEQEKINVILDTDTFNECDDQFAVSYMIKSQERFNIEAITIAPYHHDNDISIEEIEVIWLGGHSILIKDNMEFNFRQDIEAVRTVFESKVKLTVIPCKNVASNLKTTIYEIEHHLKNKNEVGTYLCERFYNDGKHGIQTRRVIWDISVIAYLINKEWFEISQINCPNIKEDTSYELNTNNRLITMVDFIDSDKIYEDMFEKLGEKNEINE